MRTKNSDSSSVFLGIIFVIVFLIMITFNLNYHENSMNDWAKKNNYVLISHERCWFEVGPYWLHHEDDVIYKAVVRDKLEKEYIVWFKFGLFMQAELEK